MTINKIRFYTVSSANIKKYQEDGVICLRNVFTASEVKLVEHGIKLNMKNPSIHHDWLTNSNGIKNDAVYFNDYLVSLN